MSGEGAQSGAARAWLAAVPALFVLLWSTGFIGAKLGLPHAEPLTFLTVRFALVVAVLAPVAWLRGMPWPRDPAQLVHLAVAGLLIHGVYLGGVFSAIHHGVEAGVTALVVGIQPLLTAALAAPLLGERVSARQWLGLALGLAGVALVVSSKLAAGLGTALGMGLAVLALLGITLGTIYQKRFCAAASLVTGNVVQFAVTGCVTGALAAALETGRIHWTGEFVLALAWLVLVLSVGAISLLYLLIRRGEASRVASLFYLTPPATALIAWLLFGETFGPIAVLGMALAVAGVALVNARR